VGNMGSHLGDGVWRESVARSAAISKAAWDDGLKSIGNRILWNGGKNMKFGHGGLLQVNAAPVFNSPLVTSRKDVHF